MLECDSGFRLGGSAMEDFADCCNRSLLRTFEGTTEHTEKTETIDAPSCDFSVSSVYSVVLISFSTTWQTVGELTSFGDSERSFFLASPKFAFR